MVSIKLRYRILEEIHIWWPLATVILAVAVPVALCLYLLSLILFS